MYKMVDGVVMEATPEDEAALASLESLAGSARRMVPLAAVLARLQVTGSIPAVLAVLAQSPAAQARFLTLAEGIYADDEDARAVFDTAGVNPDVILA